MGEGISYNCYHCGAKKYFTYGVGMMDFTEEQLISRDFNYTLLNYCKNTSNLDKDNILEILKTDKCHLNKTFGNKMYICPKCSNGETNFQFILYTKKHGKFIPEYKCSHCNTTMKIATKKDKYKVFCNNCKKEIKFDKLNKDAICYFNWD